MQYNLTISDADRLAAWFLHRMGPEQRRELMADMPLVYGRVFPVVSTATITGHVTDALEKQRAPRASCGHKANEDGECGCSYWPERAPLEVTGFDPKWA